MSFSTDGIQVLLVDDDLDFAQTASELLTRYEDQVNVRIEKRPEAGLNLLEDVDIDCIVSDYDFQGANGIDFLETVREDYPKLPVILYTGKGSEAVASEAINAGVSSYLQKGSGTEQFEILANEIVSAYQNYRTEKELAQLRRQYTKLAEQNFVGIYIIQHGEFVYVNPRLATIHGYESPEDIIGLSPLELVAPEERDRVRTNLQQRISGEREEIRYQTVGLRQDGKRINIELHGSRVEYEGETAIMGAELDITERVEKEKKLRESEQRLNTLISQTPAVIYSYEVRDEGPVTTYVSESVRDVLGFEPDYFVNAPEHFEENLHPEDAEELFNVEEELWENGDRDRIAVEYRFKNKKGAYCWLHDEQQVSTDGDGAKEVFGAWWDVTERKRTEEKLRQRNEELDKFVSIVSHDLRNPLNVAKGRIDLAREERDSQHLEAAAKAIDRSSDLIDDLLALARGGHDVGERDTIVLSDFVEDCWEMVETKGAEIEIEVESTIRAERSRLRQLFENLFRNAVEHGREDVTVTIGSVQDGFYVEDDGSGIPEEEREEIFKDGYSEKQNGTGFGLSIVKQIVEAHGWNIRVDEGSEGGAVFEITGENLVAE